MSGGPGVAIVGVGTIGWFHLDAVRRAGGRLVAVVSRSQARAEQVAREWGAARAYHEFARALEDPEVELVHICTPNSQHHAMARAVIEAGKHIICEKPLGVSAAETGDLLARVRSTRLCHAVCFNNRFYPLVEEARARVAAGALGRLITVRAMALEDSQVRRDVVGWRHDPALGGPTNAFGAVGCHLADLVTFVVSGEPVRVWADLQQVYPSRLAAGDGPAREIPVRQEELGTLVVEFDSGLKATLMMSRAAPGRRYRIDVEVDGTEAALAWDSERPNQLWIGHADAPNQILLRHPEHLSPAVRDDAGQHGAYTEGFGETFFRFFRRVYQHVAHGGEGEARYPTFVDGHRSALLQEAMLRSAASGAWERVG